MSKRWSRRLSGYIAIELVLAAGLTAADFEYKAGVAGINSAKALALEDRHGNRAVIAQAGFPVTRPMADLIAVQLLKTYELSRSGLILEGKGTAEARPDDLLTAIAAALGKLAPAVVRHQGEKLSAASPDGRCLAGIGEGAALSLEECAGGEPVSGPIRTAFRVIEPAHGLMQRDEPTAAYPIQAIAIGKQVAILALGGDAPVDRFRSPGLIVMPFANDSAAFPDDPRVLAAIHQALDRVGHH